MKEMVGSCCVCSDERGWLENPLVYCDGATCNVAVHQACYGIVEVPKGSWCCRKCESEDKPTTVRCELCPSKDGALKPTDNGGWAHVVCGLYIPEVRFDSVTTMEPIVLSQIPAERFHRVCYICEQNNRSSRANVGACMQCNRSGCKQQFHVTCAQALGLLCEEAGNYQDNVKYCGYCQEHSKLKKGAHVKTIPPYKPASSNADVTGGNSSPAAVTNHADAPKQTKRKSNMTRSSSSNGSGKGQAYADKKEITSNTHGIEVNCITSMSSTSVLPLQAKGNTDFTSTGSNVSGTNAQIEPDDADTSKIKKARRSQSPGNEFANNQTSVIMQEGKSEKIEDDDEESVVLNFVEEPNLSIKSDASSCITTTETSGVASRGSTVKTISSSNLHISVHPSQSSAYQENAKANNFNNVTVKDSPNSSPEQTSTNVTEHNSKPIKIEERSEKEHKIFQNGINAPHMLGNQLNPTSTMAQKMSDTLSAELEAHSIFTSADTNNSTTLVGPPLYSKVIASARSSSNTPNQTNAAPSTSSGSNNNNTSSNAARNGTHIPQTLEQLLERQWEQGSAFLMEQAQHFDIASLLTCLHQLRAENLRLEEYIRNLKSRRDHLLGVNARLAIPLAPITQVNNIHSNMGQVQPTQHSIQQQQQQQASMQHLTMVNVTPETNMLRTASNSHAYNPSGSNAVSSRNTHSYPTHPIENGLPPTSVYHQQPRSIASHSPSTIRHHNMASTSTATVYNQPTHAPNTTTINRSSTDNTNRHADKRHLSNNVNYNNMYQMPPNVAQQMAMHRDDPYHQINPNKPG